MKLAILANTGKEGARVVIPEFIDMLRREDIESVLDSDLRDFIPGDHSFLGYHDLFRDVDLIVSFGGDGTMLHTARVSHGSGIPILGVNLGKVGFLAEIPPDEIGRIPSKLKNGAYEIVEHFAFEAVTNRGGEYFALNDIVLDRNADTRILGITVSVDDEYAGEFHADGLVISTPTGSTAHSMAAGGPLVMPDCRVTILSPICPHSLTMRPMIIDGNRAVTVGITEGIARMAVDGQSFVDIPKGCRVTIRSSAEPVRIARFRDLTYFNILHTRLRWGVSLKLKNA